MLLPLGHCHRCDGLQANQMLVLVLVRVLGLVLVPVLVQGLRLVPVPVPGLVLVLATNV